MLFYLKAHKVSLSPGWLTVSATFKNRDVFEEPTWMYSWRVAETVNHPGHSE
jgi:hypothetical protein